MKMIEIINQQRKVKINTKDFLSFADSAIQKIAAGKTATVAFVSDRRMESLNHDFRGKKKTTDVLSFPFAADEFNDIENYLGDIVVSLEQAKRQAAENNLTFETEVKQLILHGILHLCGYDHEPDNGEMNALELEFRKKLGI